MASPLSHLEGAELHLAGQPQREDDPTLAIAGVLRGLAERLMARNTGVVLTMLRPRSSRAACVEAAAQ